ncbi:hypothetical protein MNBD_UNCLBAC01-826 [hydrothermal vent metagenome]|uniref:Histidine kinase domain-containing protein n=1 Tax=hydrothermal vent metagenome TaxID=652676 RepID=A0A3B1D3T6_9ZZZZ
MKHDFCHYKRKTETELFQKISEVCSAVNTVSTSQELLEVSLKQTLNLFNASRGSIFILKENTENLELKIAQGIPSEEKERLVKRMGEGIIGRVAQTKQPIFVDDIEKDERFQNHKLGKNYRTSSFICTPLMTKDKLIGVINITDKETGCTFNKNEVQLLDFLSSQIALNYQRIQLYKKFKNVIKETEDLKTKLGKSDQETQHLKKQIDIQEKLATIGKLAGGIAHEFNNPLDGVMRYTNLCIEHLKEDEVIHGYLLEVKRGLNRMANIVRSLLACSRNNTFSSQEQVNFQQALDLSLSGLPIRTAQKNIVIEKNIDKNIPPIQDLGLERILTNLLRNAVDAITGEGKITIESSYVDNCLLINIRDTGSGIPEEKIENIFEPFFTTKDIDKGCGLGLTIVGEIIKSYNGSIDVESNQNEGTVFSINLPVEVINKND